MSLIKFRQINTSIPLHPLILNVPQKKIAEHKSFRNSVKSNRLESLFKAIHCLLNFSFFFPSIHDLGHQVSKIIKLKGTRKRLNTENFHAKWAVLVVIKRQYLRVLMVDIMLQTYFMHHLRCINSADTKIGNTKKYLTQFYGRKKRKLFIHDGFFEGTAISVC